MIRSALKRAVLIGLAAAAGAYLARKLVPMPGDDILPTGAALDTAKRAGISGALAGFAMGLV